MTAEEKLELLKMDLQLLSAKDDAYLQHLLNFAAGAMAEEGVEDDNSVTYSGVQIEYAAFLYRKRAASTSGGKDSATAMPRFLRWHLNNLLFKQKTESGL